MRTARTADRPGIHRESARAVAEIETGFREWLGPGQRIAVDADTGEEYRWSDVVTFDDEVEPEIRARLLSVIETTAFLREGVFLFSGGAQIRLSDIPPGGVFIRHIGTDHGKSVYRCTIQTRFQGSFDLAAVVN